MTADVPPEIIEHYAVDFDEDARIRDGFAELELVRVQEIVRRHLPPAPQRVLDVGGGTGVHARWLAADGYGVHVVDPVPRHVEQSGAIEGVTAEVGDARRLNAADDSADVVILFGPLYHLVDAADRGRALREAARVVRPGGLVFVGAISRFASLFDGLARGFLFDPAFRDVVEGDFRDGHHTNRERNPHWFTTAYFHHPEDLRFEVAASGLGVVDLVGIEGMAGWQGDLAARWDDPRARDLILFAAHAVESEPTLLGLSAHLLVVARK